MPVKEKHLRNVECPPRPAKGAAASGGGGAPAGGNPLGNKLQKVSFDPDDPANPAADLVKQVLMFRAFHGMWDGTNVAVCEYVTKTGEKKTIVASSGRGLHSEERIYQMLAQQGDVAQVTRMFTDREPCCDRPGGHDCRTRIATASPEMSPQTVYYSFPYDAATGTRKEGNKALKEALGPMEARAEEFRSEALKELSDGRTVVDVIPNMYTIKSVWGEGQESRLGETDAVAREREASQMAPPPPPPPPAGAT